MTMDLTALMGVAAVAGLYMAWNIGAGDVATVMSTAVGSRALSVRNAIVLAGACELAGALFSGQPVIETIRTGIVPGSTGNEMSVAVGMTCALITAAVWLNVASARGWPVSTTQTIVGAILGAALVSLTELRIDWTTIAQIASAWVAAPLVAGGLGYCAFRLVQATILEAEKPMDALRRSAPIYVGTMCAMIAFSIAWSGPRSLGLGRDLITALLTSLAAGVSGMIVSVLFFRRPSRNDGDGTIESAFVALQIFSAGFVAFAHGSNNVASAVGPLGAVLNSLTPGTASTAEVPLSVVALGAFGITIGLASYGYRAIEVIGNSISDLTPSRGFAAEFSAAAVLLIATQLGMPISATHSLVASVIGVGMARSIGAINAQVMRQLLVSWIVTLPTPAILSGLLFWGAKSLFAL